MMISKVGESVGKPPPPFALPLLAIAFGRFLIKFSGEVNVARLGKDIPAVFYLCHL
jgi:hypothetical protein